MTELHAQSQDLFKIIDDSEARFGMVRQRRCRLNGRQLKPSQLGLEGPGFPDHGAMFGSIHAVEKN